MSDDRFSVMDEWSARVNRFRRLMFVKVDGGALGTTTVVTSNLSRQGIAIIGDTSLQRGGKATICFDESNQIPATVMWRNGRRLGFRFERELNIVEYFGAQITVRKYPRAFDLEEGEPSNFIGGHQ